MLYKENAALIQCDFYLDVTKIPERIDHLISATLLREALGHS